MLAGKCINQQKLTMTFKDLTPPMLLHSHNMPSNYMASNLAFLIKTIYINITNRHYFKESNYKELRYKDLKNNFCD